MIFICHFYRLVINQELTAGTPYIVISLISMSLLSAICHYSKAKKSFR